LADFKKECTPFNVIWRTILRPLSMSEIYESLSERNITKGGKFMKIQFDRYEVGKTNPNAQGKSYPIIRVIGTALEGNMRGQEWQTKFFANAKDMVSQVKALKKGDIVKVTMTKNGNYWNPSEFAVIDEPVAIPHADTPTQSVKYNSKLDYINMAIKALGPIGKANPEAYIMKAAEIANLINEYVTDSGIFKAEKEKSKPIDEEALEPEMNDESNVPF